MSESSVLTWERRETISTPVSDGSFVMSINDWVRIKRNLSNIKEPFDWLQTVYSLFFGIFISTLLSTILVCYTAGIPNWIIILYGLTAIFSLIFTIVCFYLERKMKTEKNKSIQIIIDDIRDIEKIIPQLCKSDKEE